MDTPSPTQLRQAQERFESLLGRTTRESEWQRFFAENPYVLSMSLPLRLEPHDIIPLGRPGKTEPDFVFYPRDFKPIPFYGVIELKQPHSKIVSVTRSNVAILTRDAETAIAQGKAYRDNLNRELFHPLDRLLFLGNDSYVFVIMGMAGELSEKLANELYYQMIQSKLPGNIQIIPYDTLLKRFISNVPPKILVLLPSWGGLTSTKLKTSTAGSWPPTFNPEIPLQHLTVEERNFRVHESIERAIRDQIQLGLDILVDGQVRGDIISLVAPQLPGYEGVALPYRVVERIRPADRPIVLDDYLYAKRLAGSRPLKANIVGPMTIARATIVDPTSPYAGRNDPKLVLDLARALGQETRYLVQAGAEIVQIDEPTIADGVDLNLAAEALKLIVDIGEIPFPGLHICGNVVEVLDNVLIHFPLKMVSIEGQWLRHDKLSHINADYLSKVGKQIGLGCIEVANYSVEKLRIVENFLDLMARKLGEENIWAAMPNCGLRLMPHDVVLNKLRVMVSAASLS